MDPTKKQWMTEVDRCFRSIQYTLSHPTDDPAVRRHVREALRKYPDDVFDRAWAYHELKTIIGI